MSQDVHLPQPTGPWTAAQAATFLDQARIPVRLATNGRGGPLVQSMWFVPDGSGLWCATQHDALVVSRLREDARCGFEVAGDDPPYRGVRGTGTAEVLADEGERVLRLLLARYLDGRSPSLERWLLGRAATEVAVRVIPTTLASWDFTTRMSGPRPEPPS